MRGAAVLVFGVLSLAGLPAGALEPFQDRLAISMPQGVTSSVASVCVSGTQGTAGCVDRVPAGQRLVIEFVSAQVDVPLDQRVGLKVSVSARGKEVAHDFVLGLVARAAQDWFVGTHSTRLYADPGTTVRVTVLRTGSAGTGSAIVNLSGQLVPADLGAVLVSPNGQYRLTVSDAGIAASGPGGSIEILASGLRIESPATVTVDGTQVSVEASALMNIRGQLVRVQGSGVTDVRGAVLLLNGGCRPVARLSDLVSVPGAPSSAPIVTGSPTVLSC
jgi:hypothetical protein